MSADPMAPDTINAVSLALLIGSMGGRIESRAGQLYVTGIKPMLPELRQAITRNKAELLRMAGGR